MVNWDSYLEPPSYPEGELEQTRIVYCKNEECNDFEKEDDVTLLMSYYGRTAVGYYDCPTCKEQSEHEFELDDEDFGFDPDAWGDRARDEGW